MPLSRRGRHRKVSDHGGAFQGLAGRGTQGRGIGTKAPACRCLPMPQDPNKPPPTPAEPPKPSNPPEPTPRPAEEPTAPPPMEEPPGTNPGRDRPLRDPMPPDVDRPRM